MRSYDISETDFLTLEQAQAAINRLRADALNDREHPFLNANHPQCEDFAAFSRRLHAIIDDAEAEEKGAAQQEKLDAAREVTGGLSPADCLARGRVLLKTKGYLDGSMPQEERAALKKEIDALYLIGCQEPETSNPSVEENDDDLS
jgi:hypothetical protein